MLDLKSLENCDQPTKYSRDTVAAPASKALDTIKKTSPDGFRRAMAFRHNHARDDYLFWNFELFGRLVQEQYEFDDVSVWARMPVNIPYSRPKLADV